MTVKIQFVQDGKTSEYILNQDITIQINAAPPSSPDTQINLSSAVLSIAGGVPWGAAPVFTAQAAAVPAAISPAVAGIDMVVNISSLKVREARTTIGEPLALLAAGDKLLVSKTAEKTGKVTWRQIIKPDNLAGKWVGESHEDDPKPYLIVPSGPSAAAATVGITASGPVSAQGVSSDGIVPLTGRFSLVKRKGPHSTYTALAIDGDSSPKLGVNIRELAYFGTPQWQWTREQWLPSYASSTKTMGMKWVRFFVAHAAYNTDQIVARTRTALDSIAQQGLLAVVCFADSLSEKGMFPNGDQTWHSGSRGHVIKDYFNTGAYRANYMPFVKRIVTEFKDHPAVGLWQLMNELAIYNPPANDNDVTGFTTFVDEVSEAIYNIDNVHPISIGIINTAHIMPPGKDVRQFSREFYSKRKFIHVVTCHCYQYDHDGNPQARWEHEDFCKIDADIANETGRAMFWTEFGAGPQGDRRASSERFLNEHFVQGPASAALQWGFMLELDAIPDCGIGDSRYGYSKSLNTGYDQLTDLFKAIPPKS